MRNGSPLNPAVCIQTHDGQIPKEEANVSGIIPSKGYLANGRAQLSQKFEEIFVGESPYPSSFQNFLHTPWLRSISPNYRQSSRHGSLKLFLKKIQT